MAGGNKQPLMILGWLKHCRRLHATSYCLLILAYTNFTKVCRVFGHTSLRSLPSAPVVYFGVGVWTIWLNIDLMVLVVSFIKSLRCWYVLYNDVVGSWSKKSCDSGCFEIKFRRGFRSNCCENSHSLFWWNFRSPVSRAWVRPLDERCGRRRQCSWKTILGAIWKICVATVISIQTRWQTSRICWTWSKFPFSVIHIWFQTRQHRMSRRT